MEIKRLFVAYFSPTGNTKNTIDIIAKEISEKLNLEINEIDFTLLKNREIPHNFSEDDLLIFATPTYAGRIPNKIMPYIKDNFLGNNTPSILISTFGNRSFDDCLMEAKLIFEGNNFKVISGAGIVNTHVFSDKLALDRPNEEDIYKIKEFANMSLDKILNDDFSAVEVSGNNPIGNYYTPLKADGKPAVFLKAKSLVDDSLCIKCGKCYYSCPMESIDKDTFETKGICIKCQACIKICPKKARYFDDEAFLSHIKMLEENYERKAENQFFI